MKPIFKMVYATGMKIRVYTFLFLIDLSGSLIGQNDLVQIPIVEPENRICFPMYTVHNNTMKMTVTMYPLDTHEPMEVALEVESSDRWVKIQETKIVYPGYTAHFKQENWDDTKDIKYRINHADKSYMEGIIKKNPIDQEEIVLAAFTCNAISPWNGGSISKKDIVDNINELDPDVLFFSGDQVYHHTYHYGAWLKFGKDFRDIIRNYPTICIPDDHDIGQYNFWGNGGEGVPSSKHGDEGGFYMPVEYVKEVERAQTSHLPDAYDPTPLPNGVGVYYTNLTWGGISFAILEDRKFKSGPKGLVPQGGTRPDHYSDKNYDPKELDVDGARLLGARQLDFLEYWSSDWTNAEMKVALSQSIFVGGAHIHGPKEERLYADLDSNGWPQTGRNNALSKIRKGFGFMIGGDQHLGTVIQHGIDDWRDSGYSFCVPAIANLYPRWWRPEERGGNIPEGLPWYTGDHVDGFGNKMTLYAAANPDSSDQIFENMLDTRSAGFGVITFNKPKRTIRMDCYRRNSGVRETDQYEGWPITIQQEDNYARKAKAYLPTFITDIEDQVIQVINESAGDIEYTLRIKGKTFTPKVFSLGSYTVKLGERNHLKTYKGIKAKKKNDEVIEVKLENE